MLVSNRASRFSSFALLVCLWSGFFSKHAYSFKLYSYKEKSTLSTERLPQKGVRHLLLIDEFCAVCHEIIQMKQVQNRQDLGFAVYQKPSFQWLARLSLIAPNIGVYDVRPLKLSLGRGTPQLLTLDQKGLIKTKTYGRSEILKHFLSKKSAQH